jgi:hypothetical protein
MVVVALFIKRGESLFRHIMLYSTQIPQNVPKENLSRLLAIQQNF